VMSSVLSSFSSQLLKLRKQSQVEVRVSGVPCLGAPSWAC
jgi:hypothetical protein